MIVIEGVKAKSRVQTNLISTYLLQDPNLFTDAQMSNQLTTWKSVWECFIIWRKTESKIIYLNVCIDN